MGILLGFLYIHRIARHFGTVNELKTLGLALHNYHDEFGCFPHASSPADGPTAHSWRALVTPHLGDNFEGVADFKREYRFDEVWNGLHNCELLERYWFRKTARYLAVVGQETLWPPNGCRTLLDVPDGTGNTIMLVEMPQSKTLWLEPGDLWFDGQEVLLPDGQTKRPVSLAGCIVVMADGSVGRLNPRITKEQVRALLTVNGGEQRFHPWTLERE